MIDDGNLTSPKGDLKLQLSNLYSENIIYTLFYYSNTNVTIIIHKLTRDYPIDYLPLIATLLTVIFR